jgi:group I intron endonuclease
MDDRWKQHVYDARILYPDSNNYFHRALRKYEDSVWDHFILADMVLEELLDEYEVAYIDEFKAFTEGYNSNIGGGSNRGYRHSDEQKAKISKANKGIKKNPSSVAKQAKSLRGRIMPEYQKKKLIEAQLGTKSHHFIPWWIEYPDGTREEHYERTKTDYAKLKGWDVGTFRDRFSKSKNVGKPGKKGVFKGISVGNIGVEYEQY